MSQQVPNSQKPSDKNIRQVQQALGIDKETLEHLGQVVNVTVNNFGRMEKAQKSLIKQLVGDIPKWAKLPVAIVGAVTAGRRAAHGGLASSLIGGAVAGGTVGGAIGGPLGAAAGAGIGALSGAIEKLMGIAAAAIPGGFDLITEAITEVAASFGQYLAPIIPVVAAYVKTLGEIFLEALVPALEQVPNVIVSVVIPALKAMIRIMAGVGAAVSLMVGMLSDEIGKFLVNVAVVLQKLGFGDTAKEIGQAGMALIQFKYSMIGAAGKLWETAMNGDEVSKRFDKNLKDQSLRLNRKVSDSIGQASFTGIADVWKKVQLDAFRNPHEVEMLKYQREAADNTGKLVMLNDKNNKLTEDIKPFAGR